MQPSPTPSVTDGESAPAGPAPTVVVIGNFDGVHQGHRELLARAQAEAPTRRLVAVTFWPHPQAVIRPGSEPELLTNLDDRIALLKQAGADEVRVVSFTRDVMAWSPEQFVTQVVAPLVPEVVVVGTNFTFGARAAGTVATLAELGQRCPAAPFRVVPIDLVATDEQVTCSSLIRQSLAGGDVEAAGEHLGRPHRYVGTVVMGHQRGRELGFPTANVPVERGHLAPADGVYAGWLTRLDGPEVRLPAAISVGTNPTFDDVPDRVVEAHVLDRDDLELYGVKVRVEFVARLRGNVKFSGIDALIEQIWADCEQTRQVLGLSAS